MLKFRYAIFALLLWATPFVAYAQNANQVPSLATFRANAYGGTVWLAGYVTPGDGGQGYFLPNGKQSVTHCVDNGSTVIVDKNGTCWDRQSWGGVPVGTPSMVTVPTIAALENIGASAGANVTAAYVPGIGIYQWNATSTATPDPSDTPQTIVQVTGVTTGRMVLQNGAIGNVANIAALEALPDAPIGMTVNVGGYATPGDGGGGSFTVVSGILSASDGGTTFLVSNSAGGTYTDRYWKRKVPQNRLTPQMFGAKGNSLIIVPSSVSITAGTNALSVTGASFTSADVGKVISISGAGTSGAPLITTIASVTSSTAVTLGTNAVTTLSSSTTTIIAYGTDDTTALQNMLLAGNDFYIPCGIYFTSASLNMPNFGKWEGCANANYVSLSTDAIWPVTNVAWIMKYNGDTNGNYELGSGAGSTVEDTLFAPANYYAGYYYTDATYPSNSGNPDFGLWVGKGALATRVSSQGFITADFSVGLAAQLYEYSAESGNNGVITQDPNGTNETDGVIKNGEVAFTEENGIYVTAPFWNVAGNRAEWSANYGIQVASGEVRVNGNLLDRNGWAGVYLNSAWGVTVVGNYFARNGAGGNGTVGRWDFCTVGTNCYVTTTTVQSAQIQIHYTRDITITGNRYRAGQDDTGGGAFAPAYIYSTGTDTPGTSANVKIVGNAGEEAYSGGAGGCNANYPSLPSTSYPLCTYGGSDTNVPTPISPISGGKPSNRVYIPLVNLPILNWYTSSTSEVMGGFGSSLSITPSSTGDVRVMMTGALGNATTGDLATFNVRYGTGTAPAQGAAATGTACGIPVQAIGNSTSPNTVPFTFYCEVTGLTPGTSYWFEPTIYASAGTALYTFNSILLEEY